MSTHLSSLNKLSSADKEILKRVNNLNVIRVMDDCKNSSMTFPKIEEYVMEIINYKYMTWQTNNDIDFATKKMAIIKFIRKLDKKYKYPAKIRHAILIYHLRKLFMANEIDAYIFYELMDLLTTKNRFHSGVLEIAIMTGPGEFSCKYDCHYCPNQKGIARSYVKEEPAVRRAAQNDFDCIKQINARISSYQAIGQPGDKGEFIILGGTFSNYSDEYRTTFMRDLYYACNTYYDEVKRQPKSLEEEKHTNTTALFKVIGLTVETRPDCIDEAEIQRYLTYGVTRVQLGVQHTDDKLLKKINRQCYTKDTVRALKLLKTAGFKVLCHYMPNLPNATIDGDIEMFDNVIYNPELICDEWKIYPTSVTTTSDKDIEDVNTVIEQWYNDGKYVPYSQDGLEEVVKYVKRIIPKYIRISRIFRDIPVDNIVGGAKVPHMRQKIQNEMAMEGDYCKCIRCREIKNRTFDINQLNYTIESYEAQGGTEYFITANYMPDIETKEYAPEADKLLAVGGYIVGFCRLRIQDSNQDLDYLPTLKNSGIIRELHVYGKMVPSYLSTILSSNSQHRGIGSKLMTMAEEIAIENGKFKMCVISGAGVRGYYSNKHGYVLENHYMVKSLEEKSTNMNTYNPGFIEAYVYICLLVLFIIYIIYLY